MGYEALLGDPRVILEVLWVYALVYLAVIVGCVGLWAAWREYRDWVEDRAAERRAGLAEARRRAQQW